MSVVDGILLSYLEIRGYAKTAKRFRKESAAIPSTKPSSEILLLLGSLATTEGKRPRQEAESGLAPQSSPEKKPRAQENSSEAAVSQRSKKRKSSSVGEETAKSLKSPKSLDVTDKGEAGGGAHFKRIDASKVESALKKEKFRDFSFASKGSDVFAAKAAKDLLKVRGKDFKKEMAKKKKASWRGEGIIDDTAVHSVMFSDSD